MIRSVVKVVFCEHRDGAVRHYSGEEGLRNRIRCIVADCSDVAAKLIDWL